MKPGELARRWGTPAYTYDLGEIRRAASELRAGVPQPSRLYYSVKANPHPDVIACLGQLGFDAEVSSIGELVSARNAGIPSERILVTGPARSPEQADTAIRLGARRFSVDSPQQLRVIAGAANDARCPVEVLLRVNADEGVTGTGLAMTGVPSAFGADTSWIERDPGAFAGTRLATVRGLHFYMGSQLASVPALLRQFETSLRLASHLVEVLGADITEVDLGGGFAAPYAQAGERADLQSLSHELAPMLAEHLPGWAAGSPRLSFESGRFLTAASGVLLSTVLDVKRSKGRTFVILDAGINQLGGMSGLRRIPRMTPSLLTTARSRVLVEDTTVVGPLCTPLDVWCSGVTMPRLVPGDVVSVPNVGAYGLSASLIGFLGHQPAVEVVHDRGAVVSATKLRVSRRPTGERARGAGARVATPSQMIGAPPA